MVETDPGDITRLRLIDGLGKPLVHYDSCHMSRLGGMEARMAFAEATMRSRFVASSIGLSLVLLACTSPRDPATRESAQTSSESAPLPSETFSRLDVYLPLLEDLAGEPGDSLFVQSDICRGAGAAVHGEEPPCDDGFTEAEQAEIAQAFPEWKRVQFFRRYGDIPKAEQPISHVGNVYVWVGPLHERGDRAFRIGAGRSCGGLCGNGGTYVMKLEHGSWTNHGYAPGTGSWIA